MMRSVENNQTLKAEGQAADGSDAGLIWFAVRTRPGHEGAVVDGLRQRHFDVYLPEGRRLRRTVRGAKPFSYPLVAGLVFVGVGPDSPAIHHATDVSGVADLVRLVSGEPAAIRREADGWHFVYALQAMQAAGQFDHTPRTKSWTSGARVKITAGPWTGCIGDIIAAKSGQRARVLLAGLFGGRSGVPVDPKYLEAA